VASTRKSWLRIGEVQKMTGYSRARVQQLRKAGRLKSVIDTKGVHLYELGDVKKIAMRRHVSADRVHSAVAVQVFELFQAGMLLPDIVIRTGQSPTTIRELWEEYKRPLEGETTAERAARLMREQAEHDERTRVLELELEQRIKRKVGR
jgi:rhamnose utilization protein RhaD (predicted bifunctional aldolase and dehydrogenase)